MVLFDRLFGRAKNPVPPPVLTELERLMASVQDIPITPTGLPDETIRKVARTYIAGVNGFPPPCPCAGCLQVYSVGAADRQAVYMPVAGSA